MSTPTGDCSEAEGTLLGDATCSAFEVGKHDLQCECDWAVFPKGSESSICYVTSEERARFIVAALTHFKTSGEMDEFFKQNTQEHGQA